MRIYDTPGVYYERADATLPGIGRLRTDIAGFVGIAERGPLHTPVPIDSWRQFEAYFGSFITNGYLAYSVKAFFENSGRRCWIVRVGSDATTTAGINVSSSGPQTTWKRIEASSPGEWGNQLQVSIKEIHRAQTVTIPRETQPTEAAVRTTAGFTTRTLVRLTQPGGPTNYRVITKSDSVRASLSWDSSLTSIDLAAPIFIDSIEYTIFVRASGRILRTYTGLSLVPGHSRYGPDVLPSLVHELKMKRPTALPAAPELITILDDNGTGSPTSIVPLDLTSLQNSNGNGIFSSLLTGGSDGLVALRTMDFTGEPVSPQDSDEVRISKERGVTALNTVDEVAIVAVPDIHIQPCVPPDTAPSILCIPDKCLSSTPFQETVAQARRTSDSPPRFSEEEVFAVQMYLVNQCEQLRDRFAVLDAPYSCVRNDRLGITAIRQWRHRFETMFAALYHSWIKVVDPLSGPGPRNSQHTPSLTREVPPSGHIIGLYAKGDLSVGVHRAPANIELVWAEELTASVNEIEHGVLNESDINVLKCFPGRGIRVYGARTLSSDPDWRYINVRRLMCMIEESIEVALQWVAFEPNNHLTRTAVSLVLRSFLLSLFQQGALMGSTPDAAFFVRCNETNNPAFERDNGKLFAEIGVAASQPFEFVIVRVGRVNNTIEVSEAGTVSARDLA